MDKQKNDENIVLNLKRHLGKMMVQIDFLYRNGRSLEQFDYDILMDRTREFYELLIDSQGFNQNQNLNQNLDQNLDQNQNLDQDFDEKENQNNETINTNVEFEIEVPGDTEKNEDEDPVEEENEENIDDEDWEDEEDEIFSIEPLDIEEDDSLASRLQRQPISDIKSVVSLNDRIMMINDLFKGSSERYEKTINVLNEFPTLGGAIVYLNELRVELQWDVESEAYLKLQELVQRRFL